VLRGSNGFRRDITGEDSGGDSGRRAGRQASSAWPLALPFECALRPWFAPLVVNEVLEAANPVGKIERKALQA
jgi:hypothetical protein